MGQVGKVGQVGQGGIATRARTLARKEPASRSFYIERKVP